MKLKSDVFGNCFLRLFINGLLIENPNSNFINDFLDNPIVEYKLKIALSNDFNTANAITSIQKILKLINTCARNKEFDSDYACELLTLLDNEMWVLGIDSKIDVLNDGDLAIVKKWHEARAAKNFELADQYRNEISQRGILL